jgi:hypothetical protein
MGKRLTRWKMFSQSCDFTIIHTAGKNNVVANVLSQIYEERTANIEVEIMEDPTINKSISALTSLLIPSSPDQYSPLSYPRFTTSNATSSSSIFSSNPGYCNYKYQPNTIATMSGKQGHQALYSVHDDKEYDYEHQNGRHVPIFEEEAYKVITALADAGLQLGYKFSVFTAPCSWRLSHTAIEEAQENI